MTTPVCLAQFKKRWWTLGSVDPFSGLRTIISPGLLPKFVETEQQAKDYVHQYLDMKWALTESFLVLMKPPLNTFCAIVMEWEAKWAEAKNVIPPKEDSRTKVDDPPKWPGSWGTPAAEETIIDG